MTSPYLSKPLMRSLSRIAFIERHRQRRPRRQSGRNGKDRVEAAEDAAKEESAANVNGDGKLGEVVSERG